MITRLWRGWTSPNDADAYEALLLEEIFPNIARRAIPGYRGISLGRRPLGDEVEFVTIMWFDALADVVRFAGEDYESAVVPAKALALLARYDERSAHFETIVPPPQQPSG